MPDHLSVQTSYSAQQLLISLTLNPHKCQTPTQHRPHKSRNLTLVYLPQVYSPLGCVSISSLPPLIRFLPSYPLLHRDLVVVADGVFSQEVKLHHILLLIHFGVQFDVLHPERATADRVRCLAFLFFITCPQCQLQEKQHTLG